MFTNKKTIAFLTILLCICGVAIAQSTSLATVEKEVTDGMAVIKTIIKSVLGVAAAIGLLFTGYAIVTNNPQAKSYGVAAVVGLIVFAIAYKMLG